MRSTREAGSVTRPRGISIVTASAVRLTTWPESDPPPFRNTWSAEAVAATAASGSRTRSFMGHLAKAVDPLSSRRGGPVNGDETRIQPAHATCAARPPLMRTSSPAAGAFGWGVLAVLGALAVGGAASRPSGIALGLPGVAGLALVAGTLVLLWVARGREGPAPPSGWLVFLPLLLAIWPGAPGLKALSGPPLAVPALAAMVLALPRRPPRRSSMAFLPVVLTIYGVAAWRVQSQVGAEGDEPHYLMVAESLLRDHDLALDQDYAEGRYRAFYRTHDELAPHFRVRGREGRIYSLHAVGLSLLVLPAYALGGYPG